MNAQLIGKIGIVALVVIIAFLAANSTSGAAWGVISAIALGGGAAVAIFHRQLRP